MRISHPFHPLRGQEFPLVDRRKTWGEDRVFCDDGRGGLLRFPANWTNMENEDPFVIVASGRSFFRVADLLRLVQLIADKEKNT